MTSLVTAATRVAGGPQIPVRKKNGISIRSKKTTKSARSWASSAPSTAVCPRPMWKKKSFGRSHSRPAAHSIEAVNSSVVSRTRNRFTPSRPSL